MKTPPSRLNVTCPLMYLMSLMSRIVLLPESVNPALEPAPCARLNELFVQIYAVESWNVKCSSAFAFSCLRLPPVGWIRNIGEFVTEKLTRLPAASGIQMSPERTRSNVLPLHTTTRASLSPCPKYAELLLEKCALSNTVSA